MRSSYLAVAGGTLALFWSLEASANGRFPQSNQILFSTSDPNLIVARTTYGILPSHDNGKTWSFVCEDALGVGYSATVDPEIGLTGSNAIIGAVVTPPGLSISPDTGCSWNCAGGPLAGQAFIDLAVRLDNPHSVVSLTSTSYTDSGAEAWSTQVFQSMDDGATWSALGKPIPDAAFQAETIEVAKTDPQRIYVSGDNGLAPNRNATVWTSKDAGNTWTATVLPMTEFDPTQEDSIYIGGVDPTDANRVYLRSKALVNGGTSRLLMSTDGAATFTQLTSFPIGMPQNTSELGEFAGFALSPDGSKIYAGTREKGLFVAQRADTAADMQFKNISQIHVFCLATRNNEVWVCSDAGSTFAELKSQFVIGVTTDDGATFTPKMVAVQCVSGLAECSGAASNTMGCNATVSGASQCGATFSMWCDQNNDPTAACQCDLGDASTATGSDAEAAVEGGAPASAGGNGAKPGSSSSSCGISAVGEPKVAGLLASVAVVGLALGRRRKRGRT